MMVNFGVAIVVWLLVRALRRGAVRDRIAVLGFAIAMAVPLGAVGGYNYAHSGSTSMLGTYGGLNFYIGNHARADGVSARIPGARHVPMDEIERRRDEIPRDRPTLVYCAGGGRSAAVCEALSREGFDHLLNLEAGIGSWDGPLDRD